MDFYETIPFSREWSIITKVHSATALLAATQVFNRQPLQPIQPTCERAHSARVVLGPRKATSASGHQLTRWTVTSFGRTPT